MAESMTGFKRSCMCGLVNETMTGENVTVMGWVQRRRDLGQLIFIALRDRTGIVQVVIDGNSEEEISVGKSRLFSQSVDLRLGENRIEISALKEGKEVFSDSVIVNRKESFIKRRLESSIYLPGSGI